MRLEGHLVHDRRRSSTCHVEPFCSQPAHKPPVHAPIGVTLSLCPRLAMHECLHPQPLAIRRRACVDGQPHAWRKLALPAAAWHAPSASATVIRAHLVDPCACCQKLSCQLLVAGSSAPQQRCVAMVVRHVNVDSRR